jgi:hypothetical protein
MTIRLFGGLVLIATLALVPTTVVAASADEPQGTRSQPLMATVTTVAPIYISPKEQPVPLRTAAVGTRLEVREEADGWVQVRFGDPVFGPRVGWVRAALIRIERPELQPMDLSVPVNEPLAPSQAPGPIAQSAGRQPSPPVAPQATRIPPGYKWTGIALLAWGGVTTLTGLVAAEDVCYDSFSSFEEDCKAFKAGWIGAGVAITAAGAIVLGVGNARREPVPANSLMLGKNRVIWRVRF